MSGKMVSWKGSGKRRSGARGRSSSPSPVRTPGSGRTPSYKTSGSARSASPVRAPSYKTPSARSSSFRTNSRSDNPMSFTPGTKTDLRDREAKVERRRLQAEAKSHKLAMQTQQQELRHMKRQQGLEYAAQHRETYGITPATKYGLLAAGIAGIGYFFLF